MSRIAAPAAKGVLLGLIFAASLVLFGGTAEAQSARTNADVNLRAGPGTEYSTIITIPAGSYVNILGCTAGYEWCGVDFAGLDGYSAGRYLTVLSGPSSGQLLTAAGVGIALSIPIWRYDYWRPKYYYQPGYRPPGWKPHKPMRPPGARPPRPERPPGTRPPRPERPPGTRPPRPERPPGTRPPRPERPPGLRPPGQRPPGATPPRPNRPSTRPTRPDRPSTRPGGKNRPPAMKRSGSKKPGRRPGRKKRR